MNFDHSHKQIFNWVSGLTAQQDYHALTHNLLDILSTIAWIDHAVAYEIFKHERKKTGEIHLIDEYLIRKFPLDITRTNEDSNNNVLSLFNPESDINYSPANANDLINWALFRIKGGGGPDRLIHVQGEFVLNNLDLMIDLQAVYQNLVILHDSKERDALTKLPNRQSLEIRLLEVCEKQKILQSENTDEKTNSWVAILDIDHFKRINDEFGHLYGDEVLLTFSQLLSKNFRYYDYIFRFGGEEFVVILNLIDKMNALAAFERFRDTVSRHSFPAVNRVTVSIGLTQLEGLSLPTTQLDRADQALYHAKETGRNKVVLYENVPEFSHRSTNNDVELF